MGSFTSRDLSWYRMEHFTPRHHQDGRWEPRCASGVQICFLPPLRTFSSDFDEKGLRRRAPYSCPSKNRSAVRT
jgi:hypothetical protein